MRDDHGGLADKRVNRENKENKENCEVKKSRVDRRMRREVL